MKTIFKGTKLPLWWVGKQISCQCGFVGELEQDDHKSVSFIWNGQQDVIYACPCCAREIGLKRIEGDSP